MINGWILVPVVIVAFLGRSEWVEGFAAQHHEEPRKVCLVLDEQFQCEARALAADLNIPTVSPGLAEELENYHHLLRLVPFEVAHETVTYALALESNRCPESNQNWRGDRDRRKPKQKTKQKPFYVDLCPPENSSIGKRGSQQGGRDFLVKAVGPAKSVVDGKKGAVVYDLTAGLGQDSLVLALNGACKIFMVEREPIVAALLQDAVRRLGVLASQPGTDGRAAMAMELSQKMILHHGDGVEVMKELIESGAAPPPDVIYLDPMFPPRTKSSKVKKNMVLLHELLDTQATDDAGDIRRVAEETRLVNEALQATAGRVVVKRPARSLPLGGDTSPRPSYAIEGSVNRWDVYITTTRNS